jgi:hypothetical protein
LEEHGDFLLVPEVVAGGDDIDAGVKEFISSIDSDSRAAGGVFSVGDDDVQVEALAKIWKKLPERVPSGFANNVTDKKQVHEVESIAQERASKLYGGIRGGGEEASLLKSIYFQKCKSIMIRIRITIRRGG